MIEMIRNYLEFPDSEPLEKLKEKIEEYRKNKALSIFITSNDIKEFFIVLAGVAIGSIIGNLTGKTIIPKLKKAVAVLLS